MEEEELPYRERGRIGLLYMRKWDKKPFIMTGLMFTERDWYYVMIPEDGDLSGICMLSCVCDVQDFGYEKMRKKKEVENI